MATSTGPKWVVIADLRGGMNTADPPLSLPENQCTEAINVDWFDGLIARRRGGSTGIADTGGTSFTAPIDFVIRFVPGGDETAAELWAGDSASPTVIKRMAGGTSWADVTLSHNIASTPTQVYGTTLNGKLYLAYDTSVDRLHCYDPSLASPRVRVVGLAASGAPTVANTGSGSYAATKRYYKQDTIQLDGTRVVRQSELSASVSFTPSGSGTAARVTQGTLPGEQETHWRVWSSSDDATYYLVSGNIAVGTTTYDDSASVASYSTGTVADPAGTYALWTSVRWIISDGNRLLGAGAWESGNKTSRVYFSPVLGSLDHGDDERVVSTTSQKNFVDLNENDGGAITGLAILGTTPIVFKYRAMHRLVPTGDVSAPYLPRRISGRIGCVSAKSLAVAEDEQGRECLYWLSHRGPYRYSEATGLQYLGRDLETIWTAMNLGATNMVAHTVYHQDKHQVWFFVASSGQNDPDICCVFDTLLGRPNALGQVRGGWSKHVFKWSIRCSTMFANTLGSAMSYDLKPYLGTVNATTATKVIKADTADAFDHSSSGSFVAKITTKPILPTSTLGINFGLGQCYLIAKAVASSSIDFDIFADWASSASASTTIALDPASTETRVIKKIDNNLFSGFTVLQIQFLDEAGVTTPWTVLDAIVAPLTVEEQR